MPDDAEIDLSSPPTDVGVPANLTAAPSSEGSDTSEQMIPFPFCVSFNGRPWTPPTTVTVSDSITFSLTNNQMTDVTVAVVDLRTNSRAIDNVPLNVNDTVSVTIVADSDGRGSATWAFASPDGSVNSEKTQDGIRNGDRCTLG